VKIGIFISARNPTPGGGYTITYDILNSLIKKIRINQIDSFYFILINDKNNYIKNKLILKKIKFSEFNENNYSLHLKNIFFNIFPFLLSIIRFFNLDKFYKLEKINKLDIVWYLSAEYSYPRFNNYISTVWDLMHITDKQFPEVGNFFTRTYRSIVIRNFLKKSKKIITGSNYTINILKKNYQIKPNLVIKASHPTPSTFLSIKKSKFLSIKKSRLNNKINKYFLYPANFWQHKNHLNLVAGFNLFKIDEKFKYKLVLVGDKKDINYYNKVVNLISSTDSKNNIFILNFVSKKKLINLYDSCKSLVYSSYCGPENLPPLEAFARNKPVLSSMYKGAKEQLGNLPIYFQPNNILSISRSFKTLVNGIDKKKYNFYKFAQYKSTEKYIDKILNDIYYHIETKPNIFVLGLNAGSHGDSSACLIKNGRLVAAVEEEKFKKIKHCSSFPVESIKYCLKENNIKINNVNYIAINGNSSVNFLLKLNFFF
jgi:glycosyltransferase involved in cell wall biosynthesis